MDALLLGVAF